MDDLSDAPQTLDEIPRAPTQDGPKVRLYLVCLLYTSDAADE